MDIAIVGTGYVGLVSGTCFAEMGINVTCIDIDEKKITRLKKCEIPIYEPGLEQLVKKNVNAKRLFFSTNLSSCLDFVDIVICAVGTPPDYSGNADVKGVLSLAKVIGQHLKKYAVIVIKSTVPVGTTNKVKSIILEELINRGEHIEFDVASNPEFLKEGTAIRDFMSPDRVIVGTDSDKAKRFMKKLYKPFMLTNDRLLFTDIVSAEMIKYTANSMLATRISFMNDIANLCELVGADVDMVRKGIGSDLRIGNKFLYAGCGYGGSCFPKDVRALIRTAEQYGYEMKVVKAVETVNETQKEILFHKLFRHFNGALSSKTIAIWGLSFKPETDDMREAPSLTLISLLAKEGTTIRVYDPIAINECKKLLKDTVIYCEDMYDALENADALICVTEWKEFRIPKWDNVKKKLKGNVILDGRNIYDKHEIERYGFVYIGIGK